MTTGRKTLHDLLAPISEALRHESVPDTPLVYSTATVPARVTDGLSPRELIDAFMSEAQKIHVDVHRCLPGEVASTVADIVASTGEDAPSVVMAADEQLTKYGIADALNQANVWGSGGAAEENISRAKMARFGITSAVCGIAETGTVVLTVSAQSPRFVSLLPLAHIAVLEANAIVGTMGDYLRAIGSDADKEGSLLPFQHHSVAQTVLSSQICFVSGPSATADIELVRVEGVHGPMYEHYVVVDHDDK